MGYYSNKDVMDAINRGASAIQDFTGITALNKIGASFIPGTSQNKALVDTLVEGSKPGASQGIPMASFNPYTATGQPTPKVNEGVRITGLSGQTLASTGSPSPQAPPIATRSSSATGSVNAVSPTDSPSESKAASGVTAGIMKGNTGTPSSAIPSQESTSTPPSTVNYAGVPVHESTVPGIGIYIGKDGQPVYTNIKGADTAGGGGIPSNTGDVSLQQLMNAGMSAVDSDPFLKFFGMQGLGKSAVLAGIRNGQMMRDKQALDQMKAGSEMNYQNAVAGHYNKQTAAMPSSFDEAKKYEIAKVSAGKESKILDHQSKLVEHLQKQLEGMMGPGYTNDDRLKVKKAIDQATLDYHRMIKNEASGGSSSPSSVRPENVRKRVENGVVKYYDTDGNPVVANQ